MSHSIQRDQRRRLLVYKSMLKRVQYKTILQDLSLSTATRDRVMAHRLTPSAGCVQPAPIRQSISRGGSISRIRNRCASTGRGRGVARFCKLCRIMIRAKASQAILMGVRKSCW